MANIGSDVQSTSVELVSVIEEMKERKAQLDQQISLEEKEVERLLREREALENHLSSLSTSLSQKRKASNNLNCKISETYTAFKTILDASRTLLSTAKEESSVLRNSVK